MVVRTVRTDRPAGNLIRTVAKNRSTPFAACSTRRRPQQHRSAEGVEAGRPVGREDLRLSRFYRRWPDEDNERLIVPEDLKKMGNLGSLFSLAYDRGGKVIEMIRNRLGEERFWEFCRTMYRGFTPGRLSITPT